MSLNVNESKEIVEVEFSVQPSSFSVNNLSFEWGSTNWAVNTDYTVQVIQQTDLNKFTINLEYLKPNYEESVILKVENVEYLNPTTNQNGLFVPNLIEFEVERKLPGILSNLNEKTVK